MELQDNNTMNKKGISRKKAFLYQISLKGAASQKREAYCSWFHYLPTSRQLAGANIRYLNK
jgi:hypothetical protein